MEGRPPAAGRLGGLRSGADPRRQDLHALGSQPIGGRAGDLVIYGTGAPGGDVSYIPEAGAHAGPSPDEMRTFIAAPAHVTVPAVTHPVELYELFVAYQRSP